MNDTDNTIDTARIAEILGVSREYVTDRITKRPGFPRPVINVSRKVRRWSEAEVRKWAANAGQPA
jgi:predicted DNA-binding transcriptional regulator AlpA